MFPWAHGGTLVDYWSRNRKGNTESNELLWLVKQFSGLSSALGDLHRHWNSRQGNSHQEEDRYRNCVHGDVKPENILLFIDGTERFLKISDMGLAAFHLEPYTNIRGPSGMPMGTSRYTPPEMRDRNEEGKPRSRTYDLWSMGCVILELLVWLTSGYNALNGFKSRTPHFWSDEIGKAAGHQIFIHPYVNAYMETLSQNLQADGRGDSLLMDLLNIVRKLLVDKDQRLGAYRLASDLENVHKLCTANATYQRPFQMSYPEEEIQRNSKQKPPLVYSCGPLLQVQKNYTHHPVGKGPDDGSSSTLQTTPRKFPDNVDGGSSLDGHGNDSIPEILVNGPDTAMPDAPEIVPHDVSDASQEVSRTA